MKKLTYGQLKNEALMNYDKSDSWGSCMELFFAIAAELDTRNLVVPESWGYKPSILGTSHEDGDYAGELMQSASDSSLYKLGKILNRLSSILMAQDRAY